MRLESITQSLFSHLLPTQCCCCRTSLNASARLSLCDYCHYALPWLGHSCEVCALPLQNLLDRICGQCLKKPPAFSHSLIPFSYLYPCDQMILKFKYRESLSIGRCLSQVLIDHIQHANEPLPELIIPVPMYHWRQFQRGYNQSEQLARDLSRSLKIPLASRTCFRRQVTQSQKGSNKQTRELNLRNSFYLAPKAKEQLQGKHLALVDDVVTTGATTRELSQLLMSVGAASVCIWALARTPAPGQQTTTEKAL